MNCQICLNSFDHSIHKPYMLSCPHTFCLSCINKLTANKCPVCNIEIKAKNSNIALLGLIPESLYDKLKVEAQKVSNETIEIKNALKKKRETKLTEYLNKLSEIRSNIKNETSKLIEVFKTNELKLLNEVTDIEQYLKENLSLSQQELESEAKLAKLKPTVENNLLSEEELTKLVNESNTIKKKINEIDSELELFKENIEFIVFENGCLKDGLIGEIQTNKKVYFIRK